MHLEDHSWENDLAASLFAGMKGGNPVWSPQSCERQDLLALPSQCGYGPEESALVVTWRDLVFEWLYVS